MVIFHIICKIILIYLVFSSILAVFDIFKTFYGVITNKIKGDDDDMKIFGTLEKIFFPSIVICDLIFTLIRKIFKLPDDDELENP